MTMNDSGHQRQKVARALGTSIEEIPTSHGIERVAASDWASMLMHDSVRAGTWASHGSPVATADRLDPVMVWR